MIIAHWAIIPENSNRRAILGLGLPLPGAAVTLCDQFYRFLWSRYYADLSSPVPDKILLERCKVFIGPARLLAVDKEVPSSIANHKVNGSAGNIDGAADLSECRDDIILIGVLTVYGSAGHLIALHSRTPGQSVK